MCGIQIFFSRSLEEIGERDRGGEGVEGFFGWPVDLFRGIEVQERLIHLEAKVTKE